MNEFWFRPRSFGYGATPVTWEGWAVVGIYAALVIVCALMLALREDKWVVWMSLIVLATVAMVPLARLKTDGPWAWSWGASEISGKTE
jgi:hypothetical protein